MPTPSNDAFRRTGRSVAYTEALRRNRDTVAAGIADGGRELTWVELAADVYGDTTDDGATPQVWSVDADDYIAATDGDGDTITATVRDTTGLLFGAKGDWVLCRSSRQSDDPQTILELVWAAELIVANTTGDVAASDPSFDVTTPGGSTLDDVDNWAGWSAASGQQLFIAPDGDGGWTWVSGPWGAGQSCVMQATLTADCDPGSSTAAFESAYPVDGKPAPSTPPTTAENTGWLGKSGAVLTIGYRNSDSGGT